jgi:AcrR family transcriptional regulator
MIRSELGENPSIQLPVASVHSVLSFNSQAVDPAPQAPVQTGGLSSSVDATMGRRERRRKEVYERLLNAARDVIVTRGLENATVKDITDAADVGKGTFFLHFRSKEHVVPALLERDGIVYQRALERAHNGDSVIKLFEVLLSVNQTAVSLDNVIFFRSHVLAVIAKDDVRELAMRCLTVNSERLEALLTLGQERGEIRRDYSAADMVRLTQQVSLGAKLLAMWGKFDASTDYLTSSRQLLLALMQVAPDSHSKPARQSPISAERGKAPAAARRRRTRRL